MSNIIEQRKLLIDYTKWLQNQGWISDTGLFVPYEQADDFLDEERFDWQSEFERQDSKELTMSEKTKEYCKFKHEDEYYDQEFERDVFESQQDFSAGYKTALRTVIGNKERMAKWMQVRIESEHRKYAHQPNFNWAEMAAIKIAKTISEK